MIAIDKTMYENQFDRCEQIEYAIREEKNNLYENEDSFVLQLIELVLKIKDHNLTIDIEFHLVQLMVREVYVE
jgi:hypothetical protein